MELEYNGVRLELLTLDRLSRVGVYDASGVDLLYVKWTIGAACVYAPYGRPIGTAAASLSSQTVEALQVNGVPAQQTVRGTDLVRPDFDQTLGDAARVLQPGFPAFATDAEVRDRLMQPRGILKITTYSPAGSIMTFLRSPKAGSVCDLCLGPKPIACDIVSSSGDGLTFGVYFQIETCVSPCLDGSDRMILSHRWTMEHDSDDDFYLTRIIHGEVVFNGAMIHNLNQHPDWFRQQFFHPIPTGMRRHGPKISQSPDGLTIAYMIADVDPTVTFDPGDSGATQMSIAESVVYNTPQRVI